jgi:DNA-binding CsgD family transcriptional regulator
VLFNAHDLLHSLRGIYTHLSNANGLIHPLTEREKEVVCLLATDLSNRDIGWVLFIAESTIKTNVKYAIGKLGIFDHLQLAVWAAWQGNIHQPKYIIQ